MRFYRTISFFIIVSILLGVFGAKKACAEERDPFYRDYLLQRMRIAKVRELQGDPTAKSLLQSLTVEAESIGMKLPKWAHPFEPREIASNYTTGLDKSSARQFEALVLNASKNYGLPPTLIKAVIHVESAFVKDAVSNKGAQGLMQLMPETADDIGVNNPFDPKANIFGGTKLLKKHLLEFRSLKKALIAYNAGPDWVRKNWGIPEETQDYIRKVIARYKQYKKKR